MRIVLVDLSIIAHAQYHMSGADPNPNATADAVVAKVYALSQGQPHVAICCDSGKSWRADVSAEYKANRPEREEALRHQIALSVDRLKADGFTVWAVSGYEADDLIGGATRWATLSGHDVMICTADKDLAALVQDAHDGPCVAVKSTKTGDVMDEAGVMAKLGVRPDQVRDYLSLVGDASDNVKGAKGIGPKTACALLKTYDTIDGIYAHLDDVLPNGKPAFTPATLSSLAEFAPRVDEVRTLIGLRYDAPIAWEEVLKERQVPPMEETVSDDIDATMPDEPPTPPLAGATATQMEMAVERQQALKLDWGRVVTGEVVPWEKGLEPRTMIEAKELARHAHNSRMFVGDVASEQAALMLMLAGRELGVQAMASLRAIRMVEGRPSLNADLIRAMVLSSGKAEYFYNVERTTERATYIGKRKDGQDGPNPTTLTFTIEDARRAWSKSQEKFDASGWGHNPADMLVARAGSKLARLLWPDVIHGIYCPEELDQ